MLAHGVVFVFWRFCTSVSSQLLLTSCPSGVLLENFAVCKELLIPPGTQNYVVRMRLYDTNKRLLCLTIRIVLRAQGALKILISAPYWLINKTGNDCVLRVYCSCIYVVICICSYMYICSYLFLKPFFPHRPPINFPSGQWQSRCCRSVWGAWVGPEPQPVTLLLHW